MPLNIQPLSTTDTKKTFDVILHNNMAMLVAEDGFYQYDISNASAPVLLSKLPITK